MSTSPVARVAFVSALPQLDRLFDYEIPAQLADAIKVGQLVTVPFGRSVKAREGFVIEIDTASKFAGELSQITSILSPRVLLAPKIISLCQALATRQALSLGELLKSACPDRMVRVDKSWTAKESQAEVSENHTHEAATDVQLVSLTVMPGVVTHNGVT